MNTINERIGTVLSELNLTKTAFAESLNVSQQYISKIVKTGNPSDMFIDALCTKYNVNEEWLRTGKGDMFITLTRDEEITDFVGSLLHNESDSFKKRFVSMLANLNESDWDLLEKMAEKLAEKKEG